MRLALLLTLLLGAAPATAADPASSGALFGAVLAGLDGQPVHLGPLRGKPMVVNFWARWCEPCRREIPELRRWQRRHPQWRVVGIGLENDPDAVRDFARAYDIDYLLLLAGEQGVPLMASLGNPAAGLPYTIVVGRDGIILRRFLGELRRAQLDAASAALGGRR